MSFVINSKWTIFWVLWAAGTNYWAKGGGLQEPLMCWQAAQTLWQPGGLIACGWSGEWACEVEPFISGIWWHHMVSEVSAEHPTSDPNPAGMGAFSCVLVTDMFFVGCDRREEKRCVLLRLMSAVERREEWRRKAFFFSYCTGCHLLTVGWHDSFTQRLPQPALPVLPLHFQAT